MNPYHIHASFVFHVHRSFTFIHFSRFFILPFIALRHFTIIMHHSFVTNIHFVFASALQLQNLILPTLSMRQFLTITDSFITHTPKLVFSPFRTRAGCRAEYWLTFEHLPFYLARSTLPGKSPGSLQFRHRQNLHLVVPTIHINCRNAHRNQHPHLVLLCATQPFLPIDTDCASKHSNHFQIFGSLSLAHPSSEFDSFRTCEIRLRFIPRGHLAEHSTFNTSTSTIFAREPVQLLLHIVHSSYTLIRPVTLPQYLMQYFDLCIDVVLLLISRFSRLMQELFLPAGHLD